MASTTAVQAFELCTDLIDDLELSRLSLANCAMKAARLARILGDERYIRCFQYELSGYPTTPTGVDPDFFDLGRIAGRVKTTISEGKYVETIYRDSIEQIESLIASQKLRLEFAKPQPVNINSANPNQYVFPPSRDHTGELAITKNIAELTDQLAACRTFIYQYCLDKYFKLNVSSAAEKIFEQRRLQADALLSTFAPIELRKMESISQNLSSKNPEDWANAAHTCRRLLQSIADKLYPPEATPILKSGKRLKLGMITT
jgi:hypothetical protein